MDDFSSPNSSNSFGFAPSEANFIKPGKRPMSSMSPIIIVEKKTGLPKLVLGASGGSKILSAVAQVAIKALWLGMDVKKAIDGRRIHHQLYPTTLDVEDGFDVVKIKD